MRLPTTPESSHICHDGAPQSLADGYESRTLEQFLLSNYEAMLDSARWLARSDSHAAEDALHDAYIRLAVGQVYKAKCWRALTRTVLRNLLIHRWAARKSTILGEEALSECISTLESPTESAEARERLSSLEAALDRLPALYRRPIELTYLEGLDSETAARKLDVGYNTFRTRRQRGLNRLRMYMGADDPS